MFLGYLGIIFLNYYRSTIESILCYDFNNTYFKIRGCTNTYDCIEYLNLYLTLIGFIKKKCYNYF